MTLSDDQIAKYGVSYRHEIDAWCAERSQTAPRIPDTVPFPVTVSVPVTARPASLATVNRRTDDQPVR